MVTVRQGPIEVKPYEVKFTSSKTKRVRTPRLDGYIVWMRARVVDRSGRPLPVKRVMLHHVVYRKVRPTRRRSPYAICGGRGESFYGTGEENQALSLPPGYGYPINKRDRWETAWMLMNHRNAPDAAYIEYTAKIETQLPLTPVTPYWLRVTACKNPRDPIYNVPGGGPPGSVHARSFPWTVAAPGYIVAGGGHAHGGSKGIVLSQPRCGNRALLVSRPLYGMPDHPVYKVLPVLHEPGPIDMSWTSTAQGIPIAGGERLELTSYYDGELPHTKVMGIMHVYVHHTPQARQDCEPLPEDLQQESRAVAGRAEPPQVRVPLTGFDDRGRARQISRPPGPWRRFDGNVTVNVRKRAFSVRNISLPLGAAVRWRFRDREWHDVTVANGPEGFASPYKRRGAGFRHDFSRPGLYRLFCSLHPMAMTQAIRVAQR